MPFLQVFVTTAKLAGILASLTVAANAYSFSRYRKKNLRPFDSPIDETSDVFASFNVNGEDDGFFFGLATAPAHVEDGLKDAWLEFAEESGPEEAKEDREIADAVMGSAGGDGGSQQRNASAAKKKKKKSLKVSMEAMIRGIEKLIEVEEEEVSAGEGESHHNVAAWHNVPHPEERLRFWSEPDTELKLAKDTGVTVSGWE